ncbi:ferritin-like superfamily [Gilbertella persicaria]|uniref:ferritin-like superfamily n=1 Tax=Gilbertella persicaria TaxID=101096 RepID=UPI00221E93BA|nr:ferritin-like superfamily [Gilbertella persicaria]KAI8053154.1 ferritin-like superfamily [Gilbertella persicaria]
MVATSLAKQNFSQAAEDAINTQIQMHQMAQQTYLSAAAYFNHCEAALPGFTKFFHERAEHEGELAQYLIDYQITRGGICIIGSVPQPLLDWKSAVNAVETCLALEKDVNKSLLNLTIIAYNETDPHLKHTLKTNHLKAKVQTIENVAKGYTQLKRVGGEGLGLHMLDQDLYKHEKFVV